MFGVYKETEGKNDRKLMTIDIVEDDEELQVCAIFPDESDANSFSAQQCEGYEAPYFVYTVKRFG